MSSENVTEKKAKAFDSLYARMKKLRRRTNEAEHRAVYQDVLDEFEWHLVRIGDYNKCKVCGKTLKPDVAAWAFKKGIRWWCDEHYDIHEDPVIKEHQKAFRRLIRSES